MFQLKKLKNLKITKETWDYIWNSFYYRILSIKNMFTKFYWTCNFYVIRTMPDCCLCNINKFFLQDKIILIIQSVSNYNFTVHVIGLTWGLEVKLNSHMVDKLGRNKQVFGQGNVAMETTLIFTSWFLKVLPASQNILHSAFPHTS